MYNCLKKLRLLKVSDVHVMLIIFLSLTHSHNYFECE